MNPTKTIGIIGAGRIGSSLARHWALAGHRVILSGSRSVEKLQQAAATAAPGVSTSSISEAVSSADIVLLAVPWQSVDEALAEAGSLVGKILIDATNPLTPDFADLSIGFSNSGGEEVAKRAVGARVVKAYNSVGATLLQAVNRDFGGVRPTLFYCGDDADAKQEVAQLIRDSGFEPIDVGGIRSSRFIEPLEQLWVEVAKAGIKQEYVFHLLRR